jgi:hypothetical protein
MHQWPVPQQFSRYPIVLPIQHTMPRGRGPADAGVGWTRNLSEGGACVELAENLRRQLILHLRIRTAHGAIEAEARVIWHQELPEAGHLILHGVVFTHLAPDQRQALRDLLLAQQQEHRSGLRLPAALVVSCRVRGESGPLLRGRTGNLSRGGLLLQLSQALPPGTGLEITLHAPRGSITAEGQVAWVDPGFRQSFGDPIRHGVHFTSLGWASSLSLARLLAEGA